ncbi:MAG: alpha/beta fold hydrolase [Oleiphilus sp.]
MISLLKNYSTIDQQDTTGFEDQSILKDEENLVQLIYRFAGKKDEWFNLLLSLSNCIAINDTLPDGHPYQGISHRLLSHLKNAIKISGRLNAGSYTLLNNKTLDRLPIPAGIMNSAGRIIEINQRALKIIHQLPQWSINEQILSMGHINLSTSLEKLIASDNDFCSLPLFYEDALDKVSHEFNDHNDHHDKQLYLTQIPNPIEPAKPYIYFCFYGKAASLITVKMLKDEYSLTETEALVVMTLMEEITSSKTAKKLKLKESTIRGHLSVIYSKLDVTRKPELIRKIMLKCLNQATQNKHFFSPESEAEDTFFTDQDTSSNSYTPQHLTLNDGRKLSYLDMLSHPESDVEDVVVVLHNMMGSAFELPNSVNTLLKENKVRILIPERPGYGDSSPSIGRTHQDFCQDLRELLDFLNISKVKLVAHSIGGAYALAMAEFLPERVERIAMVNAITRMADMLTAKPVPVLIKAVHQSLRFAPFLIDPIMKMAVGKDLEHFYSQQLNYMRPTREGRAADINLLAQPEFRRYCLKNLKQSSKQGLSIWSEELKLSLVEWPFSVRNKDIEYQFWHGDEDDVISINAAIRLAKDLNTKAFFRMKDETHFLFPRHVHEVIKHLINPHKAHDEGKFQIMNLSAASA